MGPLDAMLQPVLGSNIGFWKGQRHTQAHGLFSCNLMRQIDDGIGIHSLHSTHSLESDYGLRQKITQDIHSRIGLWAPAK